MGGRALGVRVEVAAREMGVVGFRLPCWAGGLVVAVVGVSCLCRGVRLGGIVSLLWIRQGVVSSVVKAAWSCEMW